MSCCIDVECYTGRALNIRTTLRKNGFLSFLREGSHFKRSRINGVHESLSGHEHNCKESSEKVLCHHSVILVFCVVVDGTKRLKKSSIWVIAVFTFGKEMMKCGAKDVSRCDGRLDEC